MFNIIKTAALSAIIGLGAVAAVPASAQADGLYLNFGGHHRSGVGIYLGDGRHVVRHHRREERRDHRANRRHDNDWMVRGCSVSRALHKASRMGVRRAHVSRVTRHVITVRGRKWHNRVGVRFARAPGCPVIG